MLFIHVVAMATQRGCLAASPLFALEAAHALAQTHLKALAASKVWLLTTGNTEQAGSWGLARAARADGSRSERSCRQRAQPGATTVRLLKSESATWTV